MDVLIVLFLIFPVCTMAFGLSIIAYSVIGKGMKK